MKSKSLHHPLEKLEAVKSQSHQGTKLHHYESSRGQGNIIVNKQGTQETIIDFPILYSRLLQIGFTKEDLDKIAATIGGRNNLQAVFDYSEVIQKLGFDKASIAEMAAHVDGWKNLEVVDECYEVLRSFGFDNNAILKMVSFSGGLNNIQSVVLYYLRLRDLGFDNDDIVKMAAYTGGSEILKAVIEYFEPIKYSSIDRAKIASLLVDVQKPREILKTIFGSPNSKRDVICINFDTLNTHTLVRDSLTVKKRLTAIDKGKVFSHFKYSSRKNGWFYLNPPYFIKSIKSTLSEFFSRHPFIKNRYFSLPRDIDESRILVYINHPWLQNANEAQVKVMLTVLVRTRVYDYRHNKMFFLEKSQVTVVSPTEAIVRFDKLADTWHEKFSILDKSIIRDIFASWFIEVSNKWYTKQYEVQAIPPDLMVHNGEWVTLNNYALLLDFLGPALAHRTEPLKQESSLSTRAPTEAMPLNLLDSNAELAAIDAPTQSLPISSYQSSIADTHFSLGRKRKRDDIYQPNKKHNSSPQFFFPHAAYEEIKFDALESNSPHFF